MAHCSGEIGQRIVLAADGMNPDVFVWDSHERVVDYAAGRWPSTKVVMQHAMLVPPGTAAEIIACRPRAAHVQYTSDESDLYGVRLLAGTHRSRYGWVMAADAHPLRQASSIRSKGAQ